MNQFVLIVGSGLITAALLAVAAVGFTLQFSVTNVLNVAYGSVMGAAAFAAYEVNNAGANLWVSGLVATATGAALSLAMNRGVFRPFERRRAGVFTLIILSLAISLILDNAVLMVGGPFFFSYSQLGQASVRIEGVGFPPSQVLIVAAAVVLMFAVHAMQKWTKLGKAMRATATNPELAKSCGVRTAVVVDLAWVISGALCGLAGLFMGIIVGAFNSSTGSSFLVPIIAAVVLGGIGESYGAMLGALTIGIVSEAAASIAGISALKQLVAFAVLIGMLLVRPQGIISGTAAQRGLVR
jgi:branched-chain amino acid transport system permease protein/neutral amino acid transport system permease protein